MKKGLACALVSYVVWGLLPIFWKQLAAVNSIYVLCSRIIWSLVLAVICLAFRRDRFSSVREVLKNRRLCGQLILAGVAVCINWGVYIWCVSAGHIMDSSLAYYMNPLLAVLLGTVVFREKLRPMQWLSVATAFAGVVVVVVRYRQMPWLALLVGGSFAVYGALKKTAQTDAITASFFETATLAPFAIILLIVMEKQGISASGVLHGWQWLLLPASGVVTTVPLLLYSIGVQNISLTLSGILMYINPTMQLLISVFLYQEAFTTNYAILFAFVWTGLVLYMASAVLHRRNAKGVEALCE